MLRSALVVLLLSWAALARADDNWTLGLGRVSPLAEEGFSQSVGPGLALGLEYIHQFDWKVGLGAQVDTLTFGAKSGQIVVNNAAEATGKQSAKVFSAVGVVRVTPWYEEEIGPYALAGLGINTFSAKLTAHPNPGFIWKDTGGTEDRSFNRSSTGLTYLLGFGFEKVVLPSGLTAGLEARWHFFAVDKSKFDYEWAKALTIMLRLGVRFAG